MGIGGLTFQGQKKFTPNSKPLVFSPWWRPIGSLGAGDIFVGPLFGLAFPPNLVESLLFLGLLGQVSPGLLYLHGRASDQIGNFSWAQICPHPLGLPSKG